VSEARPAAAGGATGAGGPSAAEGASGATGAASPASDAALLARRADFPILENTVYMVSHSLGAMPRGVFEEMQAFASAWATRGVRAWGDSWWEMPITVGNLLGRILNAPAGSVAMLQNVTVAMEALLSAFDWKGPRNGLVTTDVDFPSCLYLMEGFRRRGARLVRVPSRDGLTFDMAELLAAIDETTQVVVISHVLFKSAEIVDVPAVVRRAREVGALVLLDAYQSVGTVPCDVTALDVDFLVGGSVKWLCGGPGAGYLYVKPSLLESLEPTFCGWNAHATPFTFDPARLEYRHDAGRFLNGTPHVACLYAAQVGYRIIADIGVPAIRARSLKLTTRLMERSRAAGFTVNSPDDPARRAGTITLGVPDGHAVAKALIAREFIVDFRPGAGVRVGPHFYNTEDEVDAIVAEMETILRTGAHRQYLDTFGQVG
jgi:kynureninase